MGLPLAGVSCNAGVKLRLVGFRVWYADGDVRRSSDCVDCLRDDWERMPGGILVVMAHKHDEDGKPYRERLSGGDWYYWTAAGLRYVPTGPEKGTWAGRPKGVRRESVKRGVYSERFDEASAEAWESTWP